MCTCTYGWSSRYEGVAVDHPQMLHEDDLLNIGNQIVLRNTTPLRRSVVMIVTVSLVPFVSRRQSTTWMSDF